MKTFKLNIFNRIKYIAVAVLALCMASCQDDEIVTGGTVKEGTPVTAVMQFSAPLQDKVTSSRAVDDKAVEDLYVLVFSGGKCIWKNHYTSELTSGSGNVMLKDIPAANAATVYAVANTNSDVYGTEGGESITRSLDAINIGSEETAMNTLVVSILSEAKNLTRVGNTWLMAGKLEGAAINKANTQIGPVILKRLDSEITFNFKSGGLCTSFKAKRWYVVNAPAASRLVEGDADASDAAGDFYSTYKKEEGERNPVVDNKFTFYIPENRKPAKNDITDYSDREKEVKGGDGKNQVDEATQKRKYVNAPDNATYVVVTGHYEGDANSTQINPGTPQNVTAEVQYIIHLGYVNQVANDFFCKRNTKYTYNVTVKGVDNIVLEVETDDEKQPGATGDVVFGGGDNLYTLDAHYETVLLRFDVVKLAEACKDVNGNLVDEAVLKQMFTAISSTPYTALPGVGEANAEDQKWVKVALNPSSSATFQSYYDCKIKDRLQSVQSMLDELKANVLDYIKNPESGKQTEYVYTCFVNEFYYENTAREGEPGDLPKGLSSSELGTVNIWKTFVNRPDRKMYIVCRRDKSQDEESSVISAAYVLSQRSIQTFYSTEFTWGETTPIVAYGMETVNETGRLEIGTPREKKAYSLMTSEENGWENTKASLSFGNPFVLPSWASYVDDGKNGYTSVQMNQQLITDVENMASLNYTANDAGKTTMQAALKDKTITKACLLRNRHEHAEADESRVAEQDLKWYLPAVYQYQGFYIGEQALSSESRLFTYPNVDNTTDRNDRFSKIGKSFYRHYISSTYRQEKNTVDITYPEKSVYVYWAEEGTTASTIYERADFTYEGGGKDYADEPTVFHYRCMRTLGGDTPGAKHNDYRARNGNRITVDLINGLSKNRSLVTNGELGVHNYQSDENKFYSKGFEVAAELNTQSYKYPEITEGSSACDFLNKKLSPGESKWRSPNLREMTLMWQFKLYNDSSTDDDGTYVISRTKMLYERTWGNGILPYRYGWGIGVTKSTQVINIGMNSNSDKKGLVRCVRDLR